MKRFVYFLFLLLLISCSTDDLLYSDEPINSSRSDNPSVEVEAYRFQVGDTIVWHKSPDVLLHLRCRGEYRSSVAEPTDWQFISVEEAVEYDPLSTEVKSWRSIEITDPMTTTVTTDHIRLDKYTDCGYTLLRVREMSNATAIRVKVGTVDADGQTLYGQITLKNILGAQGRLQYNEAYSFGAEQILLPRSATKVELPFTLKGTVAFPSPEFTYLLLTEKDYVEPWNGWVDVNNTDEGIWWNTARYDYDWLHLERETREDGDYIVVDVDDNTSGHPRSIRLIYGGYCQIPSLINCARIEITQSATKTRPQVIKLSQVVQANLKYDSHGKGTLTLRT